MLNETPIDVARSQLDELEFELDRLKNASVGTSKAGAAVRTFVGSGLDKASCDELRAAVIDENSEFSTSPRLGCLKLALMICLDANSSRARNFVQSTAIPDVTDAQKAVLSDLYYKLTDVRYTDSQLFASSDAQNDEVLRKLRLEIAQHTRAVRMLGALNDKLHQYYNKALADVAMIKLVLDDEDTQKELQTTPAVEAVKNRISLLEDAIANEQVVFMDRLSYPARTAKYVCGHCGAKNDAVSILYSRMHTADESDYITAQQCLLGQAKATLNERSIIHDTCIFAPVSCTCGYVNVPSTMFIQAYRFGVLRRWSEMPPKGFSNKAIITYGADVVQELVKDNSDCLPQIVEDIQEDILPEVSYSDIFSSQTYEAYLSSLELQAKSDMLDNIDTRHNKFLGYLISQLHIYSIGYTESDFIYSCIETFATETFRITADKYLETSKRVEELKLVLAVVSNENFTKNFTPYSDIFLSTDYIKPLLAKNISVPVVAQISSWLYPEDMLQQLTNYIEEACYQQNTLYETLINECSQIREKFIEMERTAKGDINNSLQVVMANNLFTIRANRSTTDKVLSSGIGFLVWEKLQDLYPVALLNTIISNRKVLYKTSLFKRVFMQNSQTSVKRIVHDICCMTSGQNRISNNVNITDQDSILTALLDSCLNAVNTDALVMALGINKETLLRIKASSIPSLAEARRLIIYEALNTTCYPYLSAFADGETIDGFAERLKAERLDSGEIDSAELDVYTEAEVAAAFYLVCSPFGDTANNLRGDLNAINTFTRQSYTNTFGAS